MKDEQHEFEELKGELLLAAQDYTSFIKQLTYADYITPESYSRFLQVRSILLNKAASFGAYRFKACSEALWNDSLLKKLSS